MAGQTMQFKNYIINALGFNEYYVLQNACTRIARPRPVNMAFNTSQLTVNGEPLSAFAKNYSVELISTSLISENSPKGSPITTEVDSNSGVYNSPSSVFLETNSNDDIIIVNQVIDQPMLGFKSGLQRIDTLLSNVDRSIRIQGYQTMLFIARATSISVVYGLPNFNVKSNLTITIATPCAFLTENTTISIQYPQSKSKIFPTYFSDPLGYVDAFNCNILIDGVRPPGMTCSLLNGTLTLNNAFPQRRLNPNLTIFINNVTTPVDFYGVPTIKFHLPNSISAPYFANELKGTVNPYAHYIVVKKFAPKIINQDNFQINATIFGMIEKLPINPGATIKFNLTDDFIGQTPIKIIVTNSFTGETEVGTPTKVNGIYSYVLGKEYYFSWSINFSIQGLTSPLKSPSMAKTYYLSIRFFSSAGIQIGTQSTTAMTFTA